MTRSAVSRRNLSRKTKAQLIEELEKLRCRIRDLERKQAEEALQKAHDDLEFRVEQRTEETRRPNDRIRRVEATLRESLENSPVGVAIVSHNVDRTRITGDRLFVNGALVQMFGGSSRESVINASIQDSWVNLDQLQVAEDVFKCRGKLTDFEAHRRRMDGTTWWVSMNTHPIEYGGQKCTMVWHFDVTERKATDDALRKSESSLAEAQRIARLGNWDLDLITEELYWSDEIFRMFRIERETFDGTTANFYRRVHPDDREHVRQAVDAAINDGKTYSLDHRIVLPDGEERIVHEQAEVEFDESGKPRFLRGTVQDITERKRAEEEVQRLNEELEWRVEERTRELQESEARIRAIVEYAPVNIAVKDIDGRHILIGPQSKDLFGVAAKEVLGKTSQELLPEKLAHSLMAHDRAVLESGLASEQEDEIALEDGIHTILTVKFPIPDAVGGHVGIGAISKDITERKRLERQLLQQERLATLGQLTATVSHELRNPLGVIRTSAFVLRGGLNGEALASSARWSGSSAASSAATGSSARC